MRGNTLPDELFNALNLGPDRRAEPVTTGRSRTGIWRIDTPDQNYALRLFQADEARLSDWEAQVMNYVQSQGIPAPRVHQWGYLRDRPYLLIDWLTGERLADVSRSSPDQMQIIGNAFGEVQARIHQIAVPESLREKRTEWFKWPVPANEPLLQQIIDLELRDDALIHLDYHPENVLFDGDEISGVLDWTNAHTGDPRADLARTYTILRFFAPDDVRAVLLDAWWDGYVNVAGNPGEMLPFYVWAGRALIADFEPKFNDPKLMMPEAERRHFRAGLDQAREQIEQWERLLSLR